MTTNTDFGIMMIGHFVKDWLMVDRHGETAPGRRRLLWGYGTAPSGWAWLSLPVCKQSVC